jgi:hypothetical protein
LIFFWENNDLIEFKSSFILFCSITKKDNFINKNNHSIVKTACLTLNNTFRALLIINILSTWLGDSLCLRLFNIIGFSAIFQRCYSTNEKYFYEQLAKLYRLRRLGLMQKILMVMIVLLQRHDSSIVVLCLLDRNTKWCFFE